MSFLLCVQLLITGTEQFNQKPKKGIQFLQDNHLLSSPMDNDQVAQWLRENPRLDKKMIGEYISDRKNMDLLDSFVKYDEIPAHACVDHLEDYVPSSHKACREFGFQGALLNLLLLINCLESLFN